MTPGSCTHRVFSALLQGSGYSAEVADRAGLPHKRAFAYLQILERRGKVDRYLKEGAKNARWVWFVLD